MGRRLLAFTMNMRTTLITVTVSWERQGLWVSRLSATPLNPTPPRSLHLTFQSTYVICFASALLPF